MSRLGTVLLRLGALAVVAGLMAPAQAGAQAHLLVPNLGPALWGTPASAQAPDTLAPTAGGPSDSTAAQASADTDAWGQPRNLGLAAAEAYLANFLPWVINELLPARAELKISQLSPRSWKKNLEEGFKWDDNSFAVNHFAHPLQGSMYYNAARSNGYGYWTGLLFATAGSFHWECCGETHLMSVNDWFNTALGGAAVGEMFYRTSSMVLDNQATGGERFVREAAAFLLDPNRGFTRLVSGNARRVYANPDHPADWIPNHVEGTLSMGVRVPSMSRRFPLGDLNDDFPTHGFLNFSMVSGKLADLDRQKPYDHFNLVTQFNFVNGRGLGELRIQGNLWHTDLARTENAVSKLVVMQDFDYENTGAFEQGGQGVSLVYLRHRDLSPTSSFAWRAAATLTVLGGVKSELSLLADVEGLRERFREYDFGAGPGVRVGYEWVHGGHRLLTGSYGIRYLTTLNGSSGEGYGSNHVLQTVRMRGVLPLTSSGLGIGADYEFFHRRSHFDLVEIGGVRQRAHQLQVFLSWNPVWRAG